MKDYLAINLSPAQVANLTYLGTAIQEAYVNEVSLNIPPDSTIAEGILIVIQMVVKALLTKKGSNIFAPEDGCSLIEKKGAAISPSIIKDLTLEIETVLDNTFARVQELQEAQEVEEEELVTGITLHNLDFNTSTTTLSLVVKIDTNSESIAFTVAV